MLIMHIGHISRTQSFQQNRHIIFHALVALKLLVSLISRLVACSARIVVDRQTDGQTDTPTNYCNPRCACAPRVNELRTHCSSRVMMLQNTIFSRFLRIMPDLLVDGHISHLTSSGI